MQLLRDLSSILMVKLTKSQSWRWRWRRAANSKSSLLLQGPGNLALSASFCRVRILSLSCQAFSEPAAMLIVCEVLPGTSHDSGLYVVLGPKRRDETDVCVPLGESSPQKDHWHGEPLPPEPPLECRQAAQAQAVGITGQDQSSSSNSTLQEGLCNPCQPISWAWTARQP